MITVTAQAAQQMKRLIQKQGWPEGYGLRFGLRESGCSGYSYLLDFEPSPEDDDHVHEEHGVRVFIHPLHVPFVQGSVIAWKDDLMEAGFDIQNPNVSRACGCGSSFNV